jgi:hypothetical protein
MRQAQTLNEAQLRRVTLLMAWMPPPDGIAMCHYDEC